MKKWQMWCAALGFALVLGTVGAMDHGNVGMVQGLIQIAVGLIALGAAAR